MTLFSFDRLSVSSKKAEKLLKDQGDVFPASCGGDYLGPPSNGTAFVTLPCLGGVVGRFVSLQRVTEGKEGRLAVDEVVLVHEKGGVRVFAEDLSRLIKTKGRNISSNKQRETNGHISPTEQKQFVENEWIALILPLVFNPLFIYLRQAIKVFGGNFPTFFINLSFFCFFPQFLLSLPPAASMTRTKTKPPPLSTPSPPPPAAPLRAPTNLTHSWRWT